MCHCDSMTQIQVKCRLCRVQLLSGEALLDTHGNPVKTFLDLTACGELNNGPPTQLFLSEELAPYWLKTLIAESLYTQGKINCPKCQGRLGSFDFLKNGRRCPCGRTLLPPVHFTYDRVDVVDLNRKIHITIPLARGFPPFARGLPPFDKDSDSPGPGIDEVFSLCSNGSVSNSLSTAALDNSSEMVDHSENATSCTYTTERSQPVEDCNLQELSVQRTTGDNVREDVTAETTGACEPAVTRTTLHHQISTTSEPEQSVVLETVHLQTPVTEDATHEPVGVRKRDLRRLRKNQSLEDLNTFQMLQLSDSETDEEDEVESRHCPSSTSAARQVSDKKTVDTVTLLEKKTLQETIAHQRQREALALQSDDVPLEYTCAMCLDVMLNPHTTLPCNHDFCATCLRRLAISAPVNTKCPLCRETITKCIPNSEMSKVLHKEYPLQLKLRRQQDKKIYPRNSPLPGNSGSPSFLWQLRHRHPRLMPGRGGPSRRKLFFMLLNIVIVLALSYFGMMLCRHVLGFVAEALDAIMEKLTGEKLWSEFMGVESRILTVSTVFVLYLVTACMVRFLRLFQQIENA